MLQYPSNVFPKDCTIDCTITSPVGKIDKDETMSFTFNGDYLTAIYTQWYDMKDDSSVCQTTSIPDGNKPRLYNKQKYEVTIDYDSNGFENGHDYYYRHTLTQSDANGYNIYNIYIARGKLQADIDSAYNSKAMIGVNLDCIYPFAKNGNDKRKPISLTDSLGENHVVAGMVLKIGNDSILITEYDAETGQATLKYDLSQAYPKGTSYELYCNYIVTPVYYFKCRKRPIINTTIEAAKNGIKCSFTYSQEQNVGLKYYKYVLSCNNSKIKETDNIYSYDTEFTFIEPYISTNATNVYTIETLATTQDDVTVSTTTTFRKTSNAEVILTIPLTATVEDGYIHLSWQPSGGFLYRQDMSTGNIVYIGNDSSNNGAYEDFTAGNNHHYRYILQKIIKSDSTLIGNKFYSNVVETDWTGWYITAISDIGEKYNGYKRMRRDYSNHTWHFIGEIEDVTIENNINRVIKIGNTQFPVSIGTDSNYKSGSLSAMLSCIECSGSDETIFKDNIELVEAWRNFITQHKQFIIKSQKGDVIIANITDNPSTEYIEHEQITNFSFSWSESDKVEDCVVVYGSM